MRPLVILCTGGLGNRLAALISGVRLSRVLGRELVVNWPIYSFFQADYHDLFAEPLQLEETDPFCLPPVCIGFPQFAHACQHASDVIGVVCKVEENWDRIFTSHWMVSPAEYALIKAEYSGHPYRQRGDAGMVPETISKDWAELFWALKPQPTLLATALSCCRGGCDIGVHLRELFVHGSRGYINAPAIEAVLTNYQDATCYISSDSLQTKHEWCSRLGDRAVCQANSVPPATFSGEQSQNLTIEQWSQKVASSSQAIKEAFIDFLALLHCRHLLVNSTSTFAMAASIIAGLKRIDDTQFEYKVG